MAFEQVGVEAVLAGIRQFQSDAGRFNSSVGGMARTVKNVATAPVRALSGFLSSLGDSLRRVGEIALGIIVANTFGRIAGAIRDAAQGALEGAAQFQDLTVQMETMLARRIFESQAEGAKDLTLALEEAQVPAQELLDWIKITAIRTPFSAKSVADTVAMGLALDLPIEKTKDLTLAIGDFSAGMNLAQEDQRRIILNFLQMANAGKVTGRELADLARGELVDVSEVLKIMRENLGMTSVSMEEFTKMAASGKLPVEAFFDAFQQMSEEQFAGAGERATKTLTGLIEKWNDFIQVFLGAEILGPTLDLLTARGSEFIDSLLTEDVLQSARSLGEAFGDLATVLFTDLLPALGLTAELDVQGVLNSITEVVQGITAAIRTTLGEMDAGTPLREALLIGIEELPEGIQEPLQKAINKVFDAIEGFEEGGVFGLMEAIGIDPDVVATIEGIVDDITGAFNNLKLFWEENGPAIMAAVQQVFDALFQPSEGEGFLATITQTLLDHGPEIVDTIRSIANFISNTLLPAIRGLIDFLQTDAGQRILEFAITFMVVRSIISGLIPLLLTVVGTVALMLTPLGALIIGITTLSLMVTGAILAFTIWRDELSAWLNTTFMAISDWVVEVTNTFAQWVADTQAAFINWGLSNLATILSFLDRTLTRIGLWAMETAAKFQEWLDDIQSRIRGVDWGALGRGIVDGIRNGLSSRISSLARTAAQMALRALNAAKRALGMGSPSREFAAVGANAAESMAKSLIDKFTGFMGLRSPSSVFREFGSGLMEGLAQGIVGNMRAPQIAAQIAAVNVAAPMAQAAAAPTSVTNQTTINNNLTINSSAPSEPIIADFEMMKATANAQI